MKQKLSPHKFIALFILLSLGLTNSYSQDRPQAQILKNGDVYPFNAQTLESIEDYVENPANMEFSKYGGWKARRVEATGFFRVEQIDGRWWAVDPEGYLYVHKAPNSVHINNLSADEIYQWLDENGFNGMGNWSDIEEMSESPLKQVTPKAYCPRLSFMGAYTSEVGSDIEMPVFNEDFQEVADELAREAFSPFVNDPHVFGYFSDNELPWRDQGLPAHIALSDHSDINYITANNFLAARGKNASNWDQEDQYAYIGLMGERYYSVISSAIKKVDPNHMYIGSRCNSTEKEVESFMTNQGKYVDIVTINHYARWGNRQVEIQRMSEWAGKPLMTTEFYAQLDNPGVGQTGAGFYVQNERSRGLMYQNFLSTMAQSGYVVGMHWFAFQDDRFNSHKSFIDPNGDNWPELTDHAKHFNDRIYDFIDYSDSRQKPDFELLPEADAFFQGGTNHGDNEELWAKEGNREIYMRFDLSSVGTDVTSAKINLFSVAQRSETGLYQAELVVDNDWDEMGINSSNNPDGSTILATWGDGSDQVIDVTEQIRNAVQSNDKKLSIRIISTLNNGSIPRYGSKENSNPVAHPKLNIIANADTTVNYTSIPALIQAEEFASQIGTQDESSRDIDNGTSIGHIDTGDSLSYNINVPTSGTYTIDFRVASRSNGTEFDVYQGNSVVGSFSSPATGGWYDWETVSMDVDLTAGDQSLRLVATGSGWNINWLDIDIEDNTNYTPIPALIQAEGFALQSGTQNEASRDTDNGTSIGYIDSEDFLTYNINVPTSGTYTIDFRVASRDNGAQFNILQGNAIIGNVSSDATGGWYDWETVSVDVNLTAGNQTLMLVATGSDWNINWLNIDFENSNRVDTDSCNAGTNLSLNGTIVDFSTEQNSTNTVENIIDGDDNNRWSAFGLPQFVVVDLGDNYNVNEINLATYQNRDYQFIVEGSTTSATADFFTLVDASNNTSTGTITKTFSTQTVRYVKLTTTGANSYTGSWSSIADFKIICAGNTANKSSIDGQADLFEITAFPNPFTDSITINTINSDYAIDNIQLVDITGRVILQKSINVNEETTLTNLDGINSGIYLLLVFNSQEQILKTIKVVKE